MKRLLSSILIVLAAFAAAATAQSSSAPSIPTGGNLPSTCTPASSIRQKLFFKTGSNPGLYQCLAANTWTIIAGSVSGPYSLSATFSNNLSTAIASIGATATTLPVTQDTTCSSSLVVPSTLVLRFENGAKINVNAGCSVQFQGVGLADPLAQVAVFGGSSLDAGDVTWTGTEWPRAISSEVFYHATNSVSKRINLLKSAFGVGRAVTFHLTPRPITEAVITADYQSLYFLKGTFENTYQRSTVSPVPVDPPFTIGSYSRFHSEGGAIIKQSSVNLSHTIVHTKPSAVDVVIENNHFLGSGIVWDGVDANVLLYAGCVNCHIRNNWFDDLVGYNAGIGDAGGVHSQDSSITGNYVTGYATQNLYLNGCLRCSISYNRIYFSGDVSDTFFAPIDLEPNAADAVLDDIIVEGNQIHIENSDTDYHGILANPTSSRGFRRLTIRNNTITSIETGGVGSGLLQNAIQIIGAEGLEVSGNVVRGSYYSGLTISQSSGHVFNNRTSANFLFYGSAIDAFNNQNTPGLLIESENFYPVSSAGSTFSFLMLQAQSGFYGGATSLIYESAVGRTVEFNNSTYTIQSVTQSDAFESAITTTPLPTIAAKQYTASGATVIVASDTIDFGSAHGMATGCGVFYVISSGAISGGLTNETRYWAIVTGANTTKLAATKALALAGTAVDLTSAGSGTHNIWPVFDTRFSANRYRSNDVPAGYLLETTGTSDILSTFTDGKLTSVANANHTATASSGIIVLTSLTAPRTVNLPTCVGLRGKEISVKDGSGNSATHNITIDGSGSETIDGSATIAISTNYSIRRLKCDGANWLTL